MNRMLWVAVGLIAVACVCAAAVIGSSVGRPAVGYYEGVFEKGRALEKEKKYREAAAEYDAIAAKYQGEDEPARSYRLDALYYAGNSLVRSGNWPAAKERFEKVLAAADDAAEPVNQDFPLGFRRTVLTYERLMASATMEKKPERARQLAEAGSKRIADRIAALEQIKQERRATPAERVLPVWLKQRKAFFDWKIAHPDQIEFYYFQELKKANAAKTGATSSTALTRNPDSATSGTCSGSSCACGCSATTATATAVPCCK